MKKKAFIHLPIDFGHTDAGRYQPLGQAKAPELLEAILRSQIKGTDFTTTKISVRSPSRNETADCPLKFEAELTAILGEASDEVLRVIQQGRLPFVLGGDHSVSIATATAISRSLKRGETLGALVFDAHTDFNLPGPVADPGKSREIPPGHTFSGNAHGMIHGLLGGLGDSKYELAKFCQKNSKVDPHRIAILGVRAERYPQLQETLAKANPLLISAAEIRDADRSALTNLVQRVLRHVTNNGSQPFYLSIDFDVLDPGEFSEVATPVAKGIRWRELKQVFQLLGESEGFGSKLAAIDLAEWTAAGSFPKVGKDFFALLMNLSL